MPSLGAESRGLHIVSIVWTASHDALTVQLSGIAGEKYDLNVRNAEQIQSIAGAGLTTAESGAAEIRIAFPADGRPEPTYQSGTMTIRFKDTGKRSPLREK